MKKKSNAYLKGLGKLFCVALFLLFFLKKANAGGP